MQFNKKKNKLNISKLNGGMSIGVGNYKFKNIIINNLRNLWKSDLVLLNIY